MRIHKMTKWDEGQVLIEASDTLFECARELKKTQPELAKMLRDMALQVNKSFNEFGSHDFLLKDGE